MSNTKDGLKKALEVAKHVDKNVTMWCQYNDTYIDIQQNPNKLAHLNKHPGVKFMDRGWTILGAIVFMLYFIGAAVIGVK